MGCAASSGVTTEPHTKTVVQVTSPNQYPVAQATAVHTVTVTVSYTHDFQVKIMKSIVGGR